MNHAISRGATLLAILGLGAALRFMGLAYDVRHPQHYDDRVFVNNVIEMLAAGDGDHRYYEYPGLFFYLLAIPVALVHPARIDDPNAFLAARAMVGTFGVLSIALIYRLGVRLAGPGVGLAAALLLAVSPNEVIAAHTNRPDVVLQAWTLLAFLGLVGLGTSKRGDIWAALGIGAATAIKFTGFLMFPSYVVARLQEPGSRFGRIVLVAAGAALVVLFLTPYALVHLHAYYGGVSHQMGAHYQRTLTLSSYLQNVATYAGWIVGPLGIPLSALAVVGVVVVLRGGHAAWLPLLVHLPVTVLVMSSAGIIAPRFLIPASGAIFLAAGLGVRELSRGRWPTALALTLVAGVMPCRDALGRVLPLLEPSPRDAALDWIEANLPRGARILETRPEAASELRAQLLGLDPRRYELLTRFHSQGGLQLLAPEMDLVITGPGGGARWAQGLSTVFRAERHGEILFELKAPGHSRPRYSRLEPGALTLDASANRSGVRALIDDDPGTAWGTGRPPGPGDWVEAVWTVPQPLARIELWPGDRPRREPGLTIFTRGIDGVFRQRPMIAAREPLTSQFAAGRPASQVFLLDPEPVTGVRIEIADTPPDPWSLAGLELSVRNPTPSHEGR